MKTHSRKLVTLIAQYLWAIYALCVITSYQYLLIKSTVVREELLSLEYQIGFVFSAFSFAFFLHGLAGLSVRWSLWPRKIFWGLLTTAISSIVIMSLGGIAEFGLPISIDIVHVIRRYPEYSMKMFGEQFTVTLLAGLIICSILLYWLTQKHLAYRRRANPQKHILSFLLSVVLCSWCCTSSLNLSHELNLIRLIPAFFSALPESAQKSIFRLNRQQLPDLKSVNANLFQPNILIIRLEEVSRNRFGMYSDIPTTPFLRNLSDLHPNEVFTFQNHFSNSGASDVSVPSIYSGLVPSRHGDEFGRVPIIWDYAAALGYQTFYFIPFDLEWGHLHIKLADHIDEKTMRLNYNLDALSHAGISNAKRVYDNSISDDLITERTIKFLRNRNRETNFFGILNYKISHHYGAHYRFSKASQTQNDIAESLSNDYERSILATDTQIARVFSALQDENLLENTCVLIVADHGADQRIRRHRLINYYNEVLAIPLVMYLPERSQRQITRHFPAWPQNLNKMTSNVDLVPSVVNLLGIQRYPDINAVLQSLDGHSLFEPLPSNRITEALNTNPALRHWGHRGFAVILDGIYKYLVDNDKDFLFQLHQDPSETINLLEDKLDSNAQTALRRIKAYIIQRELLRDISAYQAQAEKSATD